MIEVILFFMSMAMLLIRKSEIVSAALFCLFTWAFYFASYFLSAEPYYYAASFTDVILVLILLSWHSISNDRLVKYLIAFSGASIIINLYGLANCIFSIPHHDYDDFSAILYIMVTIVFLMRNGKYGYGTDDSDMHIFRDADNHN